MKNSISRNDNLLLIIILLVFTFVLSCGNSEEKKKNTQAPSAAVNKVQPAAPAVNAAPVVNETPAAVNKPETEDIAVSVDGHILKKAALAKDLKERLNAFGDKIPPGKMKEVRSTVKKQIVDEFIVRTLMAAEIEKRKIEATDKEIKDIINQIKVTLPADKKLDAFMKENKITREDIALGVKVKKMVSQDLGKKGKLSQKEISKFYDDNKAKFIIPESAHVRHILIAFKEGDDDKIKAEKKATIENLRKQIVDGADFAEVAGKNSDCPSKERGGDLGEIQKGQTVKPFEDAAFSQEKNAVGPVVATDFGYHIIQVLEHKQQTTTPLADIQEKIASYLEQQRETESFNALLKKLRANAKIIVNEK
jgi:peptidyl-prolyl cis-trans isomerase C